MKKERNAHNEFELTTENLYNRLGIFFFSTLFIIISILTIQYISLRFVSISLLLLSFWGYVYLLGDFIGFYLTRTFKFLRDRYEKYQDFYWITLTLIALGIFVIFGIKLMGKDKFMSDFIIVVLAMILFVLYDLGKKCVESRKSRKSKEQKN